MNLDYILQKLNEIVSYLNQMRANSKRIDELPSSTTGTKYVAAWNTTSGQTEKVIRDTFVDQNNLPIYRNYGMLPGNGIATATDVIDWMESKSIILTVGEKNTPVLIEVQKVNSTQTLKYIFLFTRGKGSWAYNNVFASDFRLLSTSYLSPTDIQPGPNVEIVELGQLDSVDDFLDAANSDQRDFDNPEVTYYMSYYVLQNEGTPQEQNVLYLAEFIGTNGSYGGGESGIPDFTDDDFVDTANSLPFYNYPFRLDFGKIIKIGKGYIENESGITPNSGEFEEDEAGDFYAGIDANGYFRMPMRYGGTGSIDSWDNFYWETGIKVNIPGEPNYVAPE